MRLLQKNQWFRHFFLLLLLCQLLGVLLNGCGRFGGRCEANFGPSPIPGLAVMGNSVYLLSSGGQALSALRASDGLLQWRASALSGYQASLTADNGRVYLDTTSSSPGSVSVFRARDGKLLWSKNTQAPLLIIHGSVYLYQDGILTALNGSNGSSRWTMQLSSFSSLQSAAGVVYLLDGQGQVHALQEANGARLWQANLDHLSLPQYRGASLLATYPRLQILQGVVYVRTDQMYALRASDGHVLWHVPLAQSSSQPFAVAHGVVYFVLNGHLSALQAADGHPIWQSQGNTRYHFFLLIPGIVYATQADVTQGSLDTSYLDALQTSDGHVLWHYHGSFIHAVAIQGSILYLLTSSASLYDSDATLLALQGHDGKPLWHHSVRATALLLQSGFLYVGLAGNSSSPCAPQSADQLTNFEAEKGSQIWHKHIQDPASSS